MQRFHSNIYGLMVSGVTVFVIMASLGYSVALGQTQDSKKGDYINLQKGTIKTGFSSKKPNSSDLFSILFTSTYNRHPRYPVLANLDNDPNSEIVFGIYDDGKMTAVDHYGTDMWMHQTGWYGFLNARDLNGDGKAEIAVSSADRHFYLFHPSGGPPYWTLNLSRYGHHIPQYGDLDGDGDDEICFGEWDSSVNSKNIANIYAVDPNESPPVLLWTFQMPDDAWTDACDLNGDGKYEVLARSTARAGGGQISIINGDGTEHWSKALSSSWQVLQTRYPFFDYNGDGNKDVCDSEKNLSVFDYADGTVIASHSGHGNLFGAVDLNDDGCIDFITVDGSTIYCLDAAFNVTWSFSSTHGDFLFTSRIFDFDEDGNYELFLPTMTHWLYIITSDGYCIFEDQLLADVASRLYVSQNMGDLDNDGLKDFTCWDVSGNLIALRQNPSLCEYTLSAEPEVARVQWYLGLLGTATYDVTISSDECFTGTVNLSVTGLPPGTRRYYFDPSDAITMQPRSSETVRLVVEVTRHALIGDYILTIRGDDGTTIHSDDVTLEVRRPPLDGRGTVAKVGGGVPEESILAQNYPNPFNPNTEIRYQIPDTRYMMPFHTTLKVYNILGQEVRTLVDNENKAGYHTVNWNGRDDVGHEVPSGVYFYTLKVGDFTATKQMILMK